MLCISEHIQTIANQKNRRKRENSQINLILTLNIYTKLTIQDIS